MPYGVALKFQRLRPINLSDAIRVRRFFAAICLSWPANARRLCVHRHANCIVSVTVPG